jgi:outer membrane receptor for ferrienterochelin and colicins
MFRVSPMAAALSAAMIFAFGVASSTEVVESTAASAATDAAASTDAAVSTDASASTDATDIQSIVVISQRLDEGRSHIQTQTGASTYTVDAEAIATMPAGANTPFNQVVLQMPEVAQDSFGQYHIRGEHNGLQYRLNGIILPEGISVFGQSQDARFVSSVSLITGALPAEFGLRTAGILDITTNNGLTAPGGSVAIYGGSHGTVEPSFTYGGGAGSFSYFVTGDFLRNDLGIESPDGSSNPIHDHTTQYHGFGYFEDILDSANKIALMLGSAVGKYQIPNLDGVEPSLGYTVNGISTYPSQDLNENQREVTQFGALSWLHSTDAFDIQSSFMARYSSLTFVPDFPGDLLFTGVAQNAFKQNMAYAAQSDAAYHLNEDNIIRAGLFVQTDHAVSNTSSAVLLTDDFGVPLSDIPTTLIDNSSKTEWIYSAYLQDEWKLIPTVTINYGLRFDRFTAYTSDNQTSPRVNVVWQALPGTTVHTGYSRYMSPPPFELVGGKDIALFTNTTNAPLTPLATSPLAEKANYYDLGVQQRITPEFTVGVDSYYKQSVNLIDEGQFGAPIILTPFNYRYGKQYGGEFTANYKKQDFSAYLNFAAQSAKGKDIESAQFNFAPEDLAYIANNYIHLDHEQQKTASGGVSYLWRDTRFSADFLTGSGLRADLELPPGVTTAYGGTGIPNGEHLPYYTQVNTGVTHVFTIPGAGTLTARFDVINILDKEYQIRNGTGVGVGAPQYGPRRGFFFGLSKSLPAL